MLYLLHGADDFSATAEAEALSARLAGPDAGAVIRLDGAATSWQALQQACLTMPLFASTHVVLVRGVIGAWSGRGEAGKKGGGKGSPAEFAALAGDLPPASHLIVLEGELTPANRYLKEIGALGRSVVQVRSFALPREGQRQGWIDARVAARGGGIDPDAAALLAERSGADLWALANEIEKLLAYTAPERRIRRPDVEALVQAGEGATGFQLVDAVTAKDMRAVVDLTERLLAAGQAPEQILALLGGRIHDLGLLAAAERERVATEEVAARAGWSSGRLGHLKRLRGTFSAAELAQARALLVAADLALKSRPTHERPVVTLLTVLAIAQRREAVELAGALAF